MSNGRIQRIDEDFLEELEDIKIERIKRGVERGMISNRRITNAIIRHQDWDKMKDDIINAKKRKDK